MNEQNNNQDVTITELPQENSAQKDGIRLTREEYATLMRKVGLPNRFER